MDTNTRRTPPGTITRRELSKQLGLSYHTLATWVRQHRGPPFIRATTRGQVWYRTEDVATWLADRATGNGYLGEQPNEATGATAPRTLQHVAVGSANE